MAPRASSSCPPVAADSWRCGITHVRIYIEMCMYDVWQRMTRQRAQSVFLSDGVDPKTYIGSSCQCSDLHHQLDHGFNLRKLGCRNGTSTHNCLRWGRFKNLRRKYFSIGHIFGDKSIRLFGGMKQHSRSKCHAVVRDRTLRKHSHAACLRMFYVCCK